MDNKESQIKIFFCDVKKIFFSKRFFFITRKFFFYLIDNNNNYIKASCFSGESFMFLRERQNCFKNSSK